MIDVIDPSTEEVIASVPEAGPDGVDARGTRGAERSPELGGDAAGAAP